MRTAGWKKKIDMSDAPDFLTAEQVCARYKGKVKKKTLANWRTTGTGPAYVRLGGKILYPAHEIEKWESSRTVKSTSEYTNK